MKLASLLTGIAVVGLVTAGDASLSVINPSLIKVAVAAELPNPQQQIELITKNKGQFGSGDQLRRFFFGDLLPISVQPGGAGMIVNLYNKANDVTFAYCATYDVVVAVRKGRVTAFPANEVK